MELHVGWYKCEPCNNLWEPGTCSSCGLELDGEDPPCGDSMCRSSKCFEGECFACNQDAVLMDHAAIYGEAPPEIDMDPSSPQFAIVASAVPGMLQKVESDMNGKVCLSGLDVLLRRCDTSVQDLAIELCCHYEAEYRAAVDRRPKEK